MFVISYLDGWGLGWFWLLRPPLTPTLTPSPLPQERGQNVTMFIDEAAICRSPFGALFGGEMVGRARGCWGLVFVDGCLGWVIVFESL